MLHGDNEDDHMISSESENESEADYEADYEAEYEADYKSTMRAQWENNVADEECDILHMFKEVRRWANMPRPLALSIVGKHTQSVSALTKVATQLEGRVMNTQNHLSRAKHLFMANRQAAGDTELDDCQGVPTPPMWGVQQAAHVMGLELQLQSELRKLNALFKTDAPQSFVSDEGNAVCQVMNSLAIELGGIHTDAPTDVSVRVKLAKELHENAVAWAMHEAKAHFHEETLFFMNLDSLEVVTTLKDYQNWYNSAFGTHEWPAHQRPAGVPQLDSAAKIVEVLLDVVVRYKKEIALRVDEIKYGTSPLHNIFGTCPLLTKMPESSFRQAPTPPEDCPQGYLEHEVRDSTNRARCSPLVLWRKRAGVADVCPPPSVPTPAGSHDLPDGHAPRRRRPCCV